MYRGLAPDLDKLPSIGLYEVNESTLNKPNGAFKWGILEYYKTNIYAVQKYFPNGGFNSNIARYEFYTRNFSNGSWSKWNTFRVYDWV